MRLALESSTWNDLNLVLVEAASLWKNSIKFRYLFSNLQRYLLKYVDGDDDCDDGPNS
jgi:hypothetical protein